MCKDAILSLLSVYNRHKLFRSLHLSAVITLFDEGFTDFMIEVLCFDGSEKDLPKPGRRMLRVRQRAARERGRTGSAPRMTEVMSSRCGGSVRSLTLCNRQCQGHTICKNKQCQVYVICNKAVSGCTHSLKVSFKSRRLLCSERREWGFKDIPHGSGEGGGVARGRYYCLVAK